MPRYDYVCAACGSRFEVLHGVHDAGPASCTLCGEGPVRKAITAPAVHFKGSGWAKKERRAPVASGAAKASSDGSSSSDDSSSSDASSDGVAASTSTGGSSDAKSAAPKTSPDAAAATSID